MAALAWLALAAITFVTLSPSRMRPHVGKGGIERVVAFAVLAFLFGMAYANWLLFTAIACIAAALLLELCQRMIPGRHGMPLDALEKMAGAALGSAAAWLLFQFF